MCPACYLGWREIIATTDTIKQLEAVCDPNPLPHTHRQRLGPTGSLLAFSIANQHKALSDLSESCFVHVTDDGIPDWMVRFRFA
jgi:hypothetical protein